MVKPKLDRPRGVLNVRASEPMAHLRFSPSEDLAHLVEHYWFVAWDVAERQVAEVLSHPSVHVVLERGSSSVVGPSLGRFTRVLEGRGRVLGTKFVPGGFRPFVDGPVTRFTDNRVDVEEIFGRAVRGPSSRALALMDADRVEEAIREIEAFLRARKPKPDASIALAHRIAQRIADDREMTKVEHVAQTFRLNKRQLQRLFHEYVGVTPKWVIQRYRLHEAAERLAAKPSIGCAELAMELGYSDQAHFIRDFKRAVGKSPMAYSKKLGE